jgi:hypothetical protein
MDNNQHPSSLLEHLPNELFIQILSYLTGIDAIFAFSCLNNRFQSLIGDYSQTIDFKSIRKTKFDFIYQHDDPKRWKFLRLSNDFRTPGNIEYFSQFYSFVDDFPQLESLSILSMQLFNQYTILSQLSSLSNLTSLTIESICGRNISSFDLPKLKQLVCTSCRHTDWFKVRNTETIIDLYFSFAELFSTGNS